MSGSLVVSAALITGLASANMTTDSRNKSTMHAQKLDTNDDGAITPAELTAHQDVRFDKLDSDESGTIEKHKFIAGLITMFHRIDRDGNGVLQDDELPGQH